MRVRKKEKIFIAAVFIFILNGGITGIIGWDDGFTYAEYAQSPYDFDFELNYGTEDWIAHGVIEILVHSNPNFQFLWNMRKFVFFGTQMTKVTDIHTSINGTDVHGIGNYRSLVIKWKSYVVYNESSTTDNETANATIITEIAYENISNETERYVDRLRSALENENYELASYYCGVVSSYIASAFYFPIHAFNDIDYWNYHDRLDDLISPFTSNYRDPNRLFIWYEYTPKKGLDLDKLRDFMYITAWNETYNLSWYSDHIHSLSVPKDITDLINTYGKESEEYGFYSHYEYLFTLCINYIADVINAVFLHSDAKGGNIFPQSWWLRIDTKWRYIIVFSVIGISTVMIIVVRGKGKNAVNRIAFWRKFKVHSKNEKKSG